MVTQRDEAEAVDSDPSPRQIAVYRKYLNLQKYLGLQKYPGPQTIAGERFPGPLAGRLVLCVGFGLQGAELALATTIAGGAFLGIEPDPQRLKAAVRNGSCDFMVNTLDEALRVLKNELRKRTPLSAGLLEIASDILPAMVERGVQPDLLADTSPPKLATSAARPTSQKRDVGHPEYRSAVDQIVERGAKMLADTETPISMASSEVVWTAANQQDLRRMDKIALELIPAEDPIRRRWLEQAAGCFYRQIPLERVLGLRPEERVHLLDAFKTANSFSAFQAPATVRWQDADGAQQTVTL